MNKLHFYKLTAMSLFLFSLPMMSGIASAASCTPGTFSNIPIPENALSIQIDTAVLVPASASLPEYCDVKGYILTSPPVVPGDKEIQFEVKLPTAWNTKFLMHGGPGNSGNINFSTAQVIAPGIDGDKFINGFGLAKGYTIAATDTGHVGSSTIDASGFRNPDGTQNVDKIYNFGYRAVHLVTISSKNIINAYYQQQPTHSYFVGTSNGGRQGLMEVQRYPLDFDAVIAAAPAWNLSGIMAKFIVDQQAQYPTDAINAVITSDKLPLIAAATMAKCDAKDGIVDGIISDPISCNFDPLKDLAICPTNTSDSTCVTLQQANVLKTFWSPVFAPNILNFGYLPGYENFFEVLGEHYGRPSLLGASPDLDYAFFSGAIKYAVYNDPNYDIHSFNLTSNSNDLLVTPLGVNLKQILDADNFNLKAFQQHGGKLILVHGLADNVVPPESSIEAFLAINLFSGLSNTFNSTRLYLIPGAFHFSTFSPGYDPAAPTHLDIIGALDNWVVNGIAPDKLIASRLNSSGIVDMTRPICPYPKKAALINKSGSIMDASNFKCVYF